MKNLALILILFGATVEAFAQVTVDAEFRFNPVYSRGFRKPLYDGDKPGFYTMQRTRLILNYEAKDDLKMEVIAQDRRFWGDQDARADVPNLAIFRAWVEKYFTPQISLKLGRQGLIYDDQYLFGELNWGGTLAHDAALLKYKSDAVEVHFGGAYNSNGGELKREHYEYDMYKALQFAWLHKDIGRLSSSLIFINQGTETADTTVHFTQTFGTNTSFKVTDNWTLKAIYYHQLGENTDDQTVNAYLFSVQSLFQISDQLSLKLGADVNSGTSEAHTLDASYTKNHTFHRNFGLPHGQFGLLDYFFVKNDTDQGVQDYYVKANFKKGKFGFSEDVHAFVSDQHLLNSTTGEVMNDFLGVESDLKLNYKFSSTFKATLGHSIMFGSSTLDEFFGGEPIKDSQYFYAVITAKPRLFQTSN